MSAVIEITELRILMQMIIGQLEQKKISEYNFQFDEYWTITQGEWLDFQKAPEPGVGSIVDDIHYLKETIKDNSRFSFIDFDRIATLLKAISGIESPVQNRSEKE